MSSLARRLFDRNVLVPFHRTLFKAVAYGSARVPGARFREEECGGVNCLLVKGFSEGKLKNRWILFLHGGAYNSGSPKTHKNGVAWLCRTAKANALLPDYRRPPEHPWPAAVDDAFASYEGLIQYPGADPKRIAVCGDSAGGGLAVALCLRLIGKKLPLPGALYVLSPWTNLADSNKSITFEKTGRRTPIDWGLEHMSRIYAGEASLEHPEISPMLANLSGLPPMLVQSGTAEILRKDGAELAQRAKACGVDVIYEPYKGAVHVLPFMTRFSGTAQKLLNRGGRFIREKTS
jgi:monoterpene epsilon-lactone hydrolase